jgi:hypothetical protein
VFRPADAGRNEASTAAAGEAGQGSAGAAGGIARRGNGLDGDAESLAGFRQPLAPVAEIPQRRTLEASVGELAQNRDNAFRVMPICRRNIDPQGKAVFGDLRLLPPQGGVLRVLLQEVVLVGPDVVVAETVCDLD